MSEWISVKERLPELNRYQPGWGHHSVMVLCWLCGIHGIGQYTHRTVGPHAGRRGWDFVGDIKRRPDQRVTHWMPLPDPPEAA